MSDLQKAVIDQNSRSPSSREKGKIRCGMTAVTRGARICSFFWLQSMVRDEGQRNLLFDLDTSIQQINQTLGINNPSSVQLTGVYHNLLRRWAM